MISHFSFCFLLSFSPRASRLHPIETRFFPILRRGVPYAHTSSSFSYTQIKPSRFTQTPRHWVWIQYRRQRSCPEQFHSQVLHGRFSWLENHPGGRFGHVRVLHRFRNHLTRDVEDLSIQDGLILVLNVADYLVNL